MSIVQLYLVHNTTPNLLYPLIGNTNLSNYKNKKVSST